MFRLKSKFYLPTVLLFLFLILIYDNCSPRDIDLGKSASLKAADSGQGYDGKDRRYENYDDSCPNQNHVKTAILYNASLTTFILIVKDCQVLDKPEVLGTGDVQLSADTNSNCSSGSIRK